MKSHPSTPAHVVDTASAPRYEWGEGCEGWHLLSAPGLSVIQERMPPGTSEVRHRHERARQFFFVLAGALMFEVEGSELAVGPGQGLFVPASAAHRVFNRATAPAEFLVVSEPPSHGDRVAA